MVDRTRRETKVTHGGRKPKIIQDKKKRGEWAESVFLARAGEEGLAASKPWGDSSSFDCVVGRPGKFVAVQVKCTLARLESGEGYICSVCSSHKAYRPGSFDFVAAYVIPEDAWYIIPEREIRGLKSISLCTRGGEAKYERYREAWSLLRKASEIGELESAGEVREEVVAVDPASAMGRMQAAGNFFRRYMERSRGGPGVASEVGRRSGFGNEGALLSLLRSLFDFLLGYPRLAPWAAFCRRFAAGAGLILIPTSAVQSRRCIRVR